MIGTRLKLARTASGLSLRDLSAAINDLVTAQAIGKYERDESMPGSTVLLALSGALDVSIDYLLSQDRVALEAVDFRKKPSAGRREEAQVQAKVLHRLEHYLAVEEALGLDGATWDRPDSAPYPISEIVEAEQAAYQVREAWHLGRDPITNLVELLEARGMKVICEPLADSIARAKAMTDFPVVLVDHADNCNSGGSQDTTVAEAMDNARIDLESGRFKEDPETEASLKLTIATILVNNGHVEDADAVSHRGVLLQDAGVLQRHLPAAELRELRTERDVPVVQR